MNRGRARQAIFHDARYYQAFLEVLEQVHQRFHCVIHAYCLLGNHYHLLIETPEANLGRVMRHINGVYTQRYNRLKRSDGPLFRGRYKAILVERDEYLLRLSRYIHRNPIDMQRPLVQRLRDYHWSSYPAYVNQAQSPGWLYRDKTYQLLGHKQRYRGYANYVEDGVDAELSRLYERGNLPGVMGSVGYREWVYEELLPELEAEQKTRVIYPVMELDVITQGVATYFKTSPESLRQVIKGPNKGGEARKIAMYLCQELGDGKLKDIADYFQLGHVGSVSFITHQVRKRKQRETKFEQLVEEIVRSIMKQAT